MNENDIILIEQYYQNMLNDAEKRAFEQRMSVDADFQKEVVAYGKVFRAIQQEGRALLKAHLQEWSAIDKPDPGRRRWMKVTVLAAILLGGAWWLLYHNTALEKLETPPAPPTGLEPPTIAPPAIEPDSPGKQVPAQAKPDPTKIYASNFKPYTDKELSNVYTLGNDNGSASNLKTFLLHYVNGRYEQALTSYEELNDRVKNSDKALLLRANALLATNQADAAMLSLEQILKTENSPYQDDARWYLAMYYLKKGKISAVREQLRRIIEHPDSTAELKNKANQLLKQLQ